MVLIEAVVKTITFHCINLGNAFIQVQICSLSGLNGPIVTKNAEVVSVSGKELVPVLYQIKTVMTAAYVVLSLKRRNAIWRLALVRFSET